MSKLHHTPHPWIDGGRIGAARWITSPTVANVAAVHGGTSNQNGEDNAQLIALATTAPHDCEHEGCPGRQLLALLRRLEWSVSVKGVGSCCPACGGEEIDGHRPGCQLASAIGKEGA